MQLKAVLGACAAISIAGCGALVGLDAPYAPEDPPAKTFVTNVDGGAASDAGVGASKDAASSCAPDGGAFACPSDPHVLACSPLTTAWPYDACRTTPASSVSFASGVMAVSVPSDGAAYCPRVLGSADVSALSLDVDVRVDQAASSPTAYADIATIVFQDGVNGLTLALNHGSWELDYGLLVSTNFVGLGVAFSPGAWTHLSLTLAPDGTVTASIDGVLRATVSVTPTPVGLEEIDLGVPAAADGPYAIALRNLLVVGQ